MKWDVLINCDQMIAIGAVQPEEEECQQCLADGVNHAAEHAKVGTAHDHTHGDGHDHGQGAGDGHAHGSHSHGGEDAHADEHHGGKKHKHNHDHAHGAHSHGHSHAKVPQFLQCSACSAPSRAL